MPVTWEKNFSDFMYSVQSVFIVGCILACVSIMCVQIVLRYVFHAPLMGVEELLYFPTMWLYMLGGANASLERSHITCGVIHVYVKKKRTIKVLNLLQAIIVIGVGLWALYWAYWYFSYALKVNKVGTIIHYPLVINDISLVVGIFLMIVYTGFECKEYFYEVFLKN